VIRADQYVALDVVFEIGEGAGRYVVKGGRYQCVGNRSLDAGRDRASRRDQRDELVTDPSDGVGHGDDHLALQGVADGARGEGGGVPWGSHDDDVGGGRGGVVPGSQDKAV
jgi:hypothetical protein